MAKNFQELRSGMSAGARDASCAEHGRLIEEMSLQLRKAQLESIALRCAERPLVSPLSDDEILGYDESGAPTR